MKAIFDTCSLMSMVRYYLPFDTNDTLIEFVKDKLTIGEWIIIDKVYEEASYLSGGVILKEMSFLKEKEFLKTGCVSYRTNTVLPPAPRRFANMLNDNFTVSVMKQRLSNAEFEVLKNQFVHSADMRQILLCWNLNHDGEEAVVVTEETGSSNDSKLFKKIPAICKQLDLSSITLPRLMKRYESEIKIEINSI